ncbi:MULTISPECIES: Ycf66 family protein [unclassified Coleofasciculus]|uniref:Ycf66 family protein n=1 Tax=unclassified Coleofasciculus TaxID=2692782 RepID=UPI001880BACB|nr:MULTISPECIES: Ycf66 family protein [unclassified Coleofasciculus]MBE9126878.1 hypothetical protein [Coleofasciculus sp. LEGE 07081]MBE9150243.1 hypothetical protein [Coleofasciculus sp. LEGE 07092]
MLPYVLALVIAFGSFAFYMAAFFFPEVHRKSDFIWSGVGFFYALVLWIGAGRITGAVLLSQMASVSLLGWLGWQTLSLRRELTLPDYKTEISLEVQEKLASSSVGKVGRNVVFQPVTSLFRKKQVEKATPSVAPVLETAATTEPLPEDVEFLETPVEETVAAEVSPTQATTEATQATEEVQTPAEEIASPAEATQATEEVKALAEEVETVAASPAETTEETAEATTPSVEVTEEVTEEPEATRSPATEKPVEREPVRDLSSTKLRPKRFGRVSGFLKTILSKPKAKDKTPQLPVTTPEPEVLPEESLSEEATAQTVPVEVTEVTEPTPPEVQATEQKTAKPPESPQEELAAEAKTSESSKLNPPQQPDPKLVEAAKKSYAADRQESRETPETPIEEIAPESQLSPPAEPIGQGDPTERELSQDDAQDIGNSENPPKQS